MNKEIKYISPESVPRILESIEQYLQTSSDPVPHYIEETKGCEQISSTLLRIQEDYYRNFFSKATYLFLSLNKGHFFTNGNKRLSATFLKLFYTLNGYIVRPRPFPTVSVEIKSSLVEIDLSGNEWQQSFFQKDDQLLFLYNIAKTVAHEEFKALTFDEWKELIYEVLKRLLIKTPS